LSLVASLVQTYNSNHFDLERPTPSFQSALIGGLLWVFVLVAVFALTTWAGWPNAELGIYPRRVSGLVGVLLAPWIHGSWEHVLGNATAWLPAWLFLWLLYRPIAWPVLGVGWAFTGVLVWVFARDSYHIGASGVLYCLLGFLLFSGIFRREAGATAVALATLMLNAGLVWGLLPIEPGVSWESHLYGFLTGAGLAWHYRNHHRTPRKQYSWDILSDDQPEPDPTGGIWDYRKRP
jgi:membrane associated rhomboid family serine protease